MTDAATGHRYEDAECNEFHACLLPALLRILRDRSPDSRSIFDLGCGNGSVAARLADAGYDVTGVDPFEEGIALAQSRYPNLKVGIGSAYEDVAARLG